MHLLHFWFCISRKLILGSMTFPGTPVEAPQNICLRAFNFPFKILHFLIDNLLRNVFGAVGALQGARRLILLHVGFGIFQNLILGSMTFWAPQPDDYICFIIWPPTITFASFLDFCIFRKLILGSMTFWTLRPDDYIYFIIWPPTITFASFLIFVFSGSSF